MSSENKIFLVGALLIVISLSLLLIIFSDQYNTLAKKHSKYHHVLSSQSIGLDQSSNQNLKCDSGGIYYRVLVLIQTFKIK
jgi:hypothetical protein